MTFSGEILFVDVVKRERLEIPLHVCVISCTFATYKEPVVFETNFFSPNICRLTEINLSGEF